MKVKLIVAKAENNAIGKDNDMLWHLPKDFKFFKNQTLGHTLIMGRKTYESIGKPLPGRKTIIITRDKNYEQKGCEIANSLNEAINLVDDNETPFIAGGASIYKQALEMDLVDEMIITEIDNKFEADTFFPIYDATKWTEISREFHCSDEKNKFDFSFVVYSKFL